MTTLILLWGNDIKNKTRIYEANKDLLPFYNTTHIQIYRHRNQETGNMDLDYETDQLCNYFKTITENGVLFCKSLGCILGLKAIVEQEIFIKQCIFIWFPLWYCERTGFPLEKYLKELTCPVLWIQKTDDPVWWYDAIRKKLWWLSPAFTCKEIAGNDHDYKEIKEIRQIILDNNAR